MTLSSTINPRIYLALGLLLLFIVVSHPAMAAESAGGGLPFDSWLTKIRSSITGPFAFTVAIIGLVGAGASLIFGGDMNGFFRTLIFIVLALSFVIAAQNTLSGITGKGAEISPPITQLTPVALA